MWILINLDCGALDGYYSEESDAEAVRADFCREKYLGGQWIKAKTNEGYQKEIRGAFHTNFEELPHCPNCDKL